MDRHSVNYCTHVFDDTGVITIRSESILMPDTDIPLASPCLGESK
jgi:hypothetical protein